VAADCADHTDYLNLSRAIRVIRGYRQGSLTSRIELDQAERFAIFCHRLSGSPSSAKIVPKSV
jgi:hypothetical protein